MRRMLEKTAIDFWVGGDDVKRLMGVDGDGMMGVVMGSGDGGVGVD